jgi:TolB protein
VLLACGLSACTVGGDDGDGDGGAPDAQVIDSGADAGPGYLVFFDEGLDASVAQRFASASPSDDAPPQILYPEDGTLVPPNLIGVDVHYTGREFDTFEVTFAQRGEPAVVVYVWCRPVGSGCIFQPWTEVWQALAQHRSIGEYAISMRGLREDRVSASSEPVTLELAQENIDGALYFWSIDPPSIRRYDFGLARRSSELFLSQTSEGTCIGCQAISRDGTRIAVGVYDEGPGFRSRVYDVATRTQVLASELDAPLPSYGASNDILLSGSRAPSDGVDRPLRIVDGTDGSLVHDFGVAGVSADWSPNGARIVFDGASADVRELQLIERSGDTWLAPTVIATPDTQAEYAPAFAPDSDWIGFTAQRTSEPVVVAMRLSDGASATLARASRGLDATWLRWNPHPYEHDGRTIFWLTFSSGREYGVAAEGPRQIWMAAFDPEADPDDPSRPAFRFPAQRADVDNFLAEWTLAVARQQCDDDSDCPDGEVCRDGFCFPEGPE